MSFKYLTCPKIVGGEVCAYGVSEWDVPAGCLRREMRRSTRLRTLKEVNRWAKRNHFSVPESFVRDWIEKGGSL